MRILIAEDECRPGQLRL